MTSYEYYCEHCGQETTTKVIDEGVGVTEFHGRRAKHVDLAVVSECCEAQLFHDLALTMEADLEPADFAGPDPDVVMEDRRESGEYD